MAKKPLKMFKVNNISEVRDVDALYCIKTATDTEFSIVVTDAFGAIVNLKDLQTPAGIQGIASDDGTIEVTGTTFKNIRLSATLVNAINSALKPGDNISDLINDAGYLTSFIEADPIFQASEASNFVSGDKANLDNQSGVNTGDETTLSIQTKRPLKTIDNKSLEGTGNIEIDYNTVINKPTEFPPSTHTHVISNVTGLQGELDNKLDENNPSATGTLTLQTDPSILVGTFDILVRNPSSGVVSKVPEATYRKSSVDVPWMEVSGKPSTFPPSAHTHTISDVTGLPTALDDLQLNKEDKSNKQNSLDTDATGTKYPTVTAVKNAIDSIYQPDTVIRYTAPTRVGNTFTFPSGGYDVLLSKQFHTNVSQLETTIAAATDGFKRIDLIYYKADDTIAKIQGTESATVAVRPEVPAGGIELCLINVFGDTIEVPEVNGAYVQKSERANVVITGSGVINQLNLVDEKATIVFKGSITQLNTISYASVPYNGKTIRLFNAQATPVTIGHSVSGYGVDFVFLDGQDYILLPNQTIEFSFDITYAPYAHHMLIGAVVDSQIEVNSSRSVSNLWNGKTILFTANCTITVPATLLPYLGFVFRTLAGVTVMWTITAPFTWETTPTTTPEKTTGSFMRRGSTNTILLDF